MNGTSSVTTVEPHNCIDPVGAIVDFARGFSLEATRPSADEIAVLAAVARPGTRVYLSAVRTRPVQDAIEAAVRLHAAGFEPVPHLAVRNFATARELDDFLARVGGEAGVRQVLVIAGDRDQPAGDFRSSIEVIDSGALQRHGIVEIGIAGYPDGHPRISAQDLDRSLADKIHVAETTGMAVHIVTQFCFDAQAMLQWIGRLRDFGVEHPVRIGFPGPTNLATLLRYARRCGVRASAAGRPGTAALCHVDARHPGAHDRRGARPQASWRDRGAFLLLRRTGPGRAMGRGGGRTPDRARTGRRIPGRAAAHRGLMQQRRGQPGRLECGRAPV
jgi:methylenetetrahydrofolate reductase (NADPH)